MIKAMLWMLTIAHLLSRHCWAADIKCATIACWEPFTDNIRVGDNKVKPPNVVLIMLDQLRYDTLGFVQAQMPLYKDRLHIRTPNIDRLASLGVVFETAYCASPVCVPARASFKTGCTLQRTGVVNNKILEESLYAKMDVFKERIDAVESLEQILAEEMRYNVEAYGKFHVPKRLFYARNDSSKRVIRYNDYDFATQTPGFLEVQNIPEVYIKALNYLLPRDGVNVSFAEGAQRNPYSNLSYMPIQLDARYGYPTDTPLDTKNHSFPEHLLGEENGRDSLGVNYTSTAVTGKFVLAALDRLVQQAEPFFLSYQLNHPHPPRVATPAFLDYYWDRRDELLVQPSLMDPMINSGYNMMNQRRYMAKQGTQYGYSNATLMAELTAVYYATVEEADFWIGKLLDRIYEAGIANNTVILFTSDHGEFLGAHSMIGKTTLLEEAARVPLILSYPGRIPQGEMVKEAVSHLDVHATLLDYLGTSYLDRSDGRSLRRYIEKESFNDVYDENFVVVERDTRFPVGATTLSGSLGEEPDYMIRKNSYKLILPKSAESKVENDMMYDLNADPYEMNNLLGAVGEYASDAIIGKAEHLKILLLEWMSRMDGPNRYYSDNRYNNYEGLGSMQEVSLRRTWRLVDYWQSEETLVYGSPVEIRPGIFLRNEYLYLGRTSAPDDTNVEDLIVHEVVIQGPDASYFRVNPTQAVVKGNGYIQIQVTFVAATKVDMASLTAIILIHSNTGGWRTIEIRGTTAL